MTVDVEDYFHVSAFANTIKRSEWDRFPRRVERNTDRVLELFDRCGIRATFFVLGWVAERHPQLIRRIVEAGHELASHGYAHIRVTQHRPAEFLEDVSGTKKLLEDTGACRVSGYRAPSFSIDGSTLWALDALLETGYQYSSSIYPIRHDHYGMPNGHRFSFRHSEMGLLEIPITTVRVLRQNLPVGGGGYFRMYPYALSRWGLRRVNNGERQPGVFYFHPWELDPAQPRQRNIDFKTRFRHYVNLPHMEHRLARLLHDFKWGRMDRIFLDSREALP